MLAQEHSPSRISRLGTTGEVMNIILCGGNSGRCVVFGTTESEPVHGEPVRLTDARMILYWANEDGLFDVASNGPAPGSRLTPVVSTTVETVWQEWVAVSEEAALSLSGFESC